ncbi:MAG TPA: nuclear transport factor 2 family protein [Steroidobacteraceae bacterium]|nr:nuclear transport factor 2 family protein [Steroidobacteraceae bacterium]
MHRTMRAALAALGLLALAACAQNTAPVDTAADEAAIRAATAAWVAAYNAGDADKIVALYADDAIMMPPDAPAAATHEAMKKYLADDMAASKAAGVSFALDADASGVSGDLAWHSGAFHVAGANGATVGTGKYAEVWRKRDGKWLMIRDVWNNDAPAAAAAPAPAAAKPK